MLNRNLGSSLFSLENDCRGNGTTGEADVISHLMMKSRRLKHTCSSRKVGGGRLYHRGELITSLLLSHFLNYFASL